MYIDGRGFEIFGHFVNWYGVIIAFGMALGVVLAYNLAKKKGVSTDNIIDLALICIPSAIFGARLYYCIFYEHDYTFWEFFKIWEGGLAIYGGVIGGAIGVIIYCLIKKINFFKLADCIVPALILGQAIGRWGNFTNKEAYGSLITDPSLQWFPFGVLIPSNNFTDVATDAVLNFYGYIPDSAWFMATFFYESMWNFLVLGALLFIFFKTNIRGLTTCGYFVLYGLGRLWIEGLRMDSLYFLGLRVSQWLSLLLILVFLSLAIYLIVRAKKNNEPIFNFKQKAIAGINDNANALKNIDANNLKQIPQGATESDLKIENASNESTILNDDNQLKKTKKENKEEFKQENKKQAELEQIKVEEENKINQQNKNEIINKDEKQNSNKTKKSQG